MHAVLSCAAQVHAVTQSLSRASSEQLSTIAGVAKIMLQLQLLQFTDLPPLRCSCPDTVEKWEVGISCAPAPMPLCTLPSTPAALEPRQGLYTSFEWR